MNIFFLLILIVVLLGANNVYHFEEAPEQSLHNLILIIALVVLASLWKRKKNRERFDHPRYPDGAYQGGKLIAGTVFASYPGKTPGLGWVL